MYRERFSEAMDDDFNTAQAIASLFDLASEINRSADEGHSTEEAQSVLMELAEVLGLKLPPPQTRTVSVSLDVMLISQEEKRFNDFRDTLLDYLKSEQPSIAHIIPKEKPNDIASNIELLISIRKNLRMAKQWALADKVRSSLLEQGIILEDTPQGTTWRYK